MKVFVATLIILLLMLSVIFINRSFILSVSHNLDSHLDKIEEQAGGGTSIEQAEEYWNTVRPYAVLSANRSIVEDIDRRFIGLRSFTDADRSADFKCELLLFRDVLKKLARPELP